MKIGCYHLISNHHNQKEIDSLLNPWVCSIENELGESLLNIGPKDMKDKTILPVIFIQSGGVEEKFKRIYPQFPNPYLLLAGCYHHALPAALEIKEYLNKKGKKVEILHGSAQWIARRLKCLKKLIETKKKCRKYRIGVLGKPSDSLIASGADYQVIRKKLGMNVYDLPLEEMIRHIDQIKESDLFFDLPEDIRQKVAGFDPPIIQQSLRIYQGLKKLAQEYGFNALTVGCLELLEFYQNTGCLAFSLLNQEGIISGCEGDVPSLVSMIIGRLLTDQPVFMSNPDCIDQEKNTIVFSHCTIPMDMCDHYTLKNHFESGMGVGICGKVTEGPVTVFKLDGSLNRYFLSEGEVTKNLESPELCCSQLQISFKRPVSEFLQKLIANHHLVCKGRHQSMFEEFFSLIL